MFIVHESPPCSSSLYKEYILRLIKLMVYMRSELQVRPALPHSSTPRVWYRGPASPYRASILNTMPTQFYTEAGSVTMQPLQYI